MVQKKLSWLICLALTSGSAQFAQAETLEQKLQRMETELQSLRQELQATRKQVAETAEVIEESWKAQTVNHTDSAESATKIGGYGELHYNKIDDSDGKINFHRFVLFFSHRFNDRIRFVSEFELEHALSGEGKPGEVELEQAYIEFTLSPETQVKAGVLLTPIGFLNETHEPPTFYGVERNPLEKNIIPTTWWEAGGVLSGQLGQQGLSYDLALTSGLKVDPTSVNIRKGRQKVAKATLNDPAITARLRYTGIAGLELGGSLHYESDITQDSDDAVGSALLSEIHVAINKGAFSAKALYARWDIDIDNPALKNKATQDGYLLETSYKIIPNVGLFIRHTGWSNTDGIDATQQNIGVNWWPHEDVVFKADIQRQNSDAGDKDGFNLGMGYQF